MSNSTCLNCGSSEMDQPLITLKFQKNELHICPQCLPTLIHQPFQLADKLPGVKLPDNPPERDE